MRKLPPQSQLRAFEAAARHLSFRKAADELAVSPTAISHHIRALEVFCGRPLFRRRPRPIALTEAGARLFPVIRAGLDSFDAALADVRREGDRVSLRITAISAFANRWLVPRLRQWRSLYPEIILEVIGTQAVVDLEAGEADVAIRYAREAPQGLVAHLLFRDRFVLVATPEMLPDTPRESRSNLAERPLIKTLWSSRRAPTWERWLDGVRQTEPDFPEPGAPGVLGFVDEQNAIDALLAGQGVGICSDVLVKSELESGKLVKLSDFALPGLGFYLVHLPGHPRQPLIDRVLPWLRTVD